MKDLIMLAIAAIVVFAIAFGIFVLCGWAVSVLLNIGLKQMGLGTINFWAGCGIVASGQFIKSFTSWGSK